MPTSLLPRSARAAFFLSLLSAAVAGQAAQITQTFDFGLERTDWTHTASLAKFNPALGVLTSIDVFLSGTINTTINLANLNPTSSAALTGTVDGTFKVGTGGLNLLTGTASVSHTATLAKNPSVKFDFKGNYATTFVPDVVTKTYSSTSTDAATLALLKGAPGNSVLFSIGAASADSSSGGGNNAYVLSDTFGAASGRIVYNYQAVPEPTSVAALGFGVVGLMRRRKAVRK